MKTPYGLPIIQDCFSCSIVTKNGFCDFPENSKEAWNRVRHNAAYPRGAVLFVEDQPAHGIYIICMGQVKVYSMASDGTTIIHRLCYVGEVLGLHETVLEGNYTATAETISPCVLNHIKSSDLKALIRTDSEIAFRVAHHLSGQLSAAYRQIQDQRFSDRATEKVARFVMASLHQGNRASVGLTHEEIGQIIGVARETVTRAVKELRSRNIIRIAGHLITVLDQSELVRLATGDGTVRNGEGGR